MVRPLPNYTAVYRGDTSRSVNIYIADSLRQKLESIYQGVSESALDSVCIRFNRAYKAKYGVELGRVDPKYLELTPHRRIATATPAVTPPAKPEPFDEHCCDYDNCKVCDNGEHNYCRRGCTIGRRPRR